MVGKLEGMAGLSGLGQGLSQGTSQMLEYSAIMRDQNIKFKLGMLNASLGLKRLAEESRQANMQQQRFYDGLKHKDLMQTRDIKARRRLQELVEDEKLRRQGMEFRFRHTESILAHDRAMEQQQVINESRERVAKTQAAPAHGRNRLMRRAQDFGLVEDIGKEAQRFVTTQLMTQDGKLSPESAESRALASGFVDNDGRGNVSAYMQSLHEEFIAGQRSKYKDQAIPVPSFSEWQGLAHGVVLGDARGQQVFMQGLANDFTKNMMFNPAEEGGEIFFHSMSSDAAIQFDADAKGDIVPANESTQAVVSVIADIDAQYPTGPVSTQTVESWATNSLASIAEQTGMVLTDMGSAKRNVTKQDIAMFEILYRNQTGRDFPVNLSGYSNNVIEATEALINNSGQIFGRDVGAVGDLPPGTSSATARSMGTVNSRVAGSVVQSRQSFANFQQRGDLNGMFSELSASSNEYRNTLEEVERLGIGDQPSIKGSLTQWALLLEGMTQVYSQQQQAFTEGTEAGIQVLEERAERAEEE